PEFSLPSGYYDSDQMLEISRPDISRTGQIIFTIDGSMPGADKGAIYSQPIHLEATNPVTAVIRARLLFPNGDLGPVRSAAYFIGITQPLPLVSLIVDPDDLWDETDGIYANPEARGIDWERPSAIFYVAADRRTSFQIDAGLRIHGQYSRAYNKKSFRLYFRQEYGQLRLDYPIFPDSDIASFKRLVLHAGGQDASQIPTNWTLLRNQLMANLALETNAWAAHSQPVLLFINGEPWGLYYFRERPDQFLFAEQYGVETAAIVDTPARRVENPDDIGPAFADWDRLTASIDANNMAEPANYAYVASQIDLANFIDFSILQIYAANFDWPFTNMKQFRSLAPGGRWQWIVWDNDLSLGLKPWSDIDDDTLIQALDPNYAGGTNLATDGRDTILLRGLLQNPAFRARFLGRASELLNTTLAPEAVIAQIDALAAAIEPAIGFENGRWDDSATLTDWAVNVDQLRDFARRRPDIMRQQIVESLGLAGTAVVAVNQLSEGMNYLLLNNQRLDTLPWEGIYLHGGELLATAVPLPGYQFSHWQGLESADNPLQLTVSNDQSLMPIFTQSPDVPQPGDVFLTPIHDAGQNQIVAIELEVARAGGVDLRGWRLTDNDAKSTNDEGSLILPNHPALTSLPAGSRLRLHLTNPNQNADDWNGSDGQITLYLGNGNLNNRADPGFNLSENDNLVLLAPGPTNQMADDQSVAMLRFGKQRSLSDYAEFLADGIHP
ncbi:MAG: hypothetical protein GY803_21925, partial [Chloroflexi bacterium]|nr:hypothetical protein [Chloroflexota bacterium]